MNGGNRAGVGVCGVLVSDWGGLQGLGLRGGGSAGLRGAPFSDGGASVAP